MVHESESFEFFLRIFDNCIVTVRKEKVMWDYRNNKFDALPTIPPDIFFIKYRAIFFIKYRA